MMLTDLLSSVRASLEENQTVPAVLDAFGQFLDNPTDWLRVNYSLSLTFDYIRENLEARFTEAVAKRSATISQNHVSNFLQLCGGNMGRLASCLSAELKPYHEVVVSSILRRFLTLSPPERKAIHATLKLLKRRRWVFQTNINEPMMTSGEFERFLAAVRAASPAMEPLRFANLLVEKGLYNKLLLLTKNQNYNAFVPSLFVMENLSSLLQKVSIVLEQVLSSYLNGLRQSESFGEIREFLVHLVKNDGVIEEGSKEIPPELDEYLTKYGRFYAISPGDLEDIEQFLDQIAREEEGRKKEDMIRQQQRQEILLKVGLESQAKERTASEEILYPVERESTGSVYLGEELDIDNFISAIRRQATEKELLQLKVIRQFSLPLAEIVKRGLAVIGASGSGRSTTAKRLLDGFGTNNVATIVLDGKGEHRGIAWKYKWKAYNFVTDPQAQEFRLSLFGRNGTESAEFAADLFEEFVLQNGWPFSAEQRARLASAIRRVTESNPSPTLEQALSEASRENDLADVSKKMAKTFLSGNMSRIFGADTDISVSGSVLFDLSGRGLRSPTTREEREIASALLLQKLVSVGLSDKIIIIEDVLDRIKSPNLQRDATESLKKLIEMKNSLVVSGRTSLRMYFAGSRPLEIVHRLAGQQTIEQELLGLSISYSKSYLKNQISFFPRGYCLVASNGRPNLLRIKPVQFS